jgi:DNA-binding winged helix-turn-helix (wHTH) protein
LAFSRSTVKPSRCANGAEKIKLQEQPFQVLLLLLSRPGELATRDKLRDALWSADTFVQFDQGLNTAIRKILLALGDSADNPRFIETVPRRGYRFIAALAGDVGPVPTVALAESSRSSWRWTIAVIGLLPEPASGFFE